MKYTLKNGLELKLKRVRAEAIRNLIADRDLAAILKHQEMLGQPDATARLENALTADELLQINSGITRLFNYCIGFGVTNNPPENERAELEAMGFDMHLSKIARVNWLRYTQLDDTEEAGQLIGSIMALAFQEPEPETPVELPEVAALKKKIAELEAGK